LSQGRYLPVEEPAFDSYGKGIYVGLLTGIDHHVNMFLRKFELYIVELEVLRCVHDVQETWDGKRELLEELNGKTLEARSGDPTNNSFNVSANTFERKPAKVRKCDVHRDWRIDQLPFRTIVGNREQKSDHERLQLRHE